MSNDIRVSTAVHAGQAIYSRQSLKFYDMGVFGINNRFFWRCPVSAVLEQYDRYASSNHMELGAGTGYLLDHCRFPTASPRLVLMDLNADCLETAKRRIARYRPQTERCNVLAPIAFEGELFDSIGFNYVLHCLPGSMPEKAVAFDHLRPLLRPGGVIFGSTVLSEGVEVGVLARKYMQFLSKRGIFSNTRDSLHDLRRAMEDRFQNVSIRIVGCVALFSARVP